MNTLSEFITLLREIDALDQATTVGVFLPRDTGGELITSRMPALIVRRSATEYTSEDVVEFTTFACSAMATSHDDADAVWRRVRDAMRHRPAASTDTGEFRLLRIVAGASDGTPERLAGTDQPIYRVDFSISAVVSQVEE